MTPEDQKRADHLRTCANAEDDRYDFRDVLWLLDALDAAMVAEHRDELRARRKLQVIEPEYAAIMAALGDESMSAVEQIEALLADRALLRAWGEMLATDGPWRASEYEAWKEKRGMAEVAVEERAFALAAQGRAPSGGGK